MAYKIVNKTQLDYDLKRIADALRSASKNSTKLTFPDGMVQCIQNLSWKTISYVIPVTHKVTSDKPEYILVDGNELDEQITYLATAIKSRIGNSGKNLTFPNGIIGAIEQGARLENMVDFDIDGTYYEVESGTTWQQWVESGKSPGYTIDYNNKVISTPNGYIGYAADISSGHYYDTISATSVIQSTGYTSYMQMGKWLAQGAYLFKNYESLTSAPDCGSVVATDYEIYTRKEDGSIAYDGAGNSISSSGGKVEIYASLPALQRIDWIEVPNIQLDHNWYIAGDVSSHQNYVACGIYTLNGCNLPSALVDWIQSNSTYYSSKPSSWQ